MGQRSAQRASGQHSSASIYEQLIYRNVQWFRGGLVFKAHTFFYRSSLGLGVKKKKKAAEERD